MSDSRRVINTMETKLTNFKKPSGEDGQITETKEDYYDNRLFSTVNVDIEAVDYNSDPEQLHLVEKANIYFHCIHCGLVVGTESNSSYK
jgi:hypothetical protein